MYIAKYYFSLYNLVRNNFDRTYKTLDTFKIFNHFKIKSLKNYIKSKRFIKPFKLGENMKKFFTKKKIIILTAITLVTALSVGAFALFGKNIEEIEIPENADLSVTTLEKPTTGTPFEFDAKSNLYIAQGELMKNPFSTYSTGKSICSLVNQDIYSERVVTPDATYKKSISYSSMVQVGTQFYVSNNQYIVENAMQSDIKSVSDYKFSNKDKYINKLSAETFESLYGKVPRSISSYVLNDSTIIDSFYVGKDENGLNQYKFTLDPTLSTAYIRNEMKTMAGCAKYPVIDAVEFTIWMDDNWIVAKTHNKASYRVEKIGMVISLVEDTTEYFTVNQNPQIPNEEFFKTKIETTEISDVVEVEKSATDILLDAFAPYLDGKTPLSLDAKTSGAIDLNILTDLYINANDLSQIKVLADIENFAKLEFKADENKLFVSLPTKTEELKIFLSLDECSDLFGGLLNELGITLDFENFDVNSLLSGIEIENNEDNLILNFKTNLQGIQIEASIDLDKKTNDILASAKIGENLNLEIKNTNTPLEEFSTESLENDFKNIKPILEQILSKDGLNFDLNSAIVNGKLSADLFDGTIVADSDIFGKNLVVEFSENTLWFTMDSITSSFNDFSGLTNSSIFANISQNLDFDFEEILSEILSNLQLTKTSTHSIISTSVLGLPISLSISENEQGVSIDKISTNLFEKEFSLKLNNTPLNRLTATQKSLANSLNGITNLLNKENFIFELKSDVINGKIDLNILNKSLVGNLKIFDKNINFEFSNNTLWLEIDDILTKLTTLDKILNSKIITNLTGEINFDLEEILTEIFTNLTLSQVDLCTTISTKVLGLPLQIELSALEKCLKIENISTTLGSHKFTLCLLENSSLSAFTEQQKSNAISLDDLAELLNNETLNLNISLFDTHALQLSINLLNFEIIGLLDNQLKLKIVDNTIYGIYNDLKFKITFSNLIDIIQKVLSDLSPTSETTFDFSSIELSDIINSLKFEKTSNELRISLKVANEELSIGIPVLNNKLQLSPISLNALGSQMQITSCEKLNFDIDTAENFVDAYSVVNHYYDSILAMINSKEITIFGDLNVLSPIENSTDKDKTSINLTSITFNFEDSKNLKLKATLSIVTTSNENGTTKTKTYNLDLYFVNSRIYFAFDGVKGQFGTDTFDNSKDSIISIFDNIPQLKDLITKLSSLTNINLNIKEWDLYSLLKNITINENNEMCIYLNLSTILNDATSLSDLTINISKAENGGIVLSSTIENLINDYDIDFNINITSSDGADFTIAESESYIVFDSINYLLETLANTIALRHFHVTADLNATFVKIASVTIKLDLLVDVYADGTFSAVVTLSHTPDGIGLTDSIAYQNYKCKTILYIEPNYDYIYGERIYKKSMFSKEATENFKISKDTFNNNIMNSLFYLLDLSSTITDLFANIDLNFSTDNLKASDIFKNFTYDNANRKYGVNLDLSTLDSNLGAMNLYITHSQKTETESAKLESISLDMSVVSVGTITLNGSLVDQLNQDYGTGLTVENFKTENSSSCTEKTFS